MEYANSQIEELVTKLIIDRIVSPQNKHQRLHYSMYPIITCCWVVAVGSLVDAHSYLQCPSFRSPHQLLLQGPMLGSSPTPSLNLISFFSSPYKHPRIPPHFHHFHPERSRLPSMASTEQQEGDKTQQSDAGRHQEVGHKSLLQSDALYQVRLIVYTSL